MHRLPIILVLLGLTLATQVRQNVVFRKVSEVTTTRSRWSITFVIDLNPYVTVMNTVGENINHLLGVIRTVVENRAPRSNGLVNDYPWTIQRARDFARNVCRGERSTSGVPCTPP